MAITARMSNEEAHRRAKMKVSGKAPTPKRDNGEELCKSLNLDPLEYRAARRKGEAALAAFMEQSTKNTIKPVAKDLAKGDKGFANSVETEWRAGFGSDAKVRGGNVKQQKTHMFELGKRELKKLDKQAVNLSNVAGGKAGESTVTNPSKLGQVAKPDLKGKTLIRKPINTGKLKANPALHGVALWHRVKCVTTLTVFAKLAKEHGSKALAGWLKVVDGGVHYQPEAYKEWLKNK